MPRNANNGAKRQLDQPSLSLAAAVPAGGPAVAPADLPHAKDFQALPVSQFQSRQQTRSVLTGLLRQSQASDAAAALVPWYCDALPSASSRKAYHDDLREFLCHMAALGVHPYAVTGDHVRLFKESLVQAGKRPASIARALSVIRGTYEQFGKKGLVPWNRVGDIQSVSAPRVTKNTTPVIGEEDACRLLHAPDVTTILGCRDHALLFTYFKTACRSSAIRRAKVSDLERSDTEWFLRVTKKVSKERRLPLLEAAPAILRWLEMSELGAGDPTSPLFPALAKDKRTATTRHLTTQAILNIVKTCGKQIGLNVSPGIAEAYPARSSRHEFPQLCEWPSPRSVSGR